MFINKCQLLLHIHISVKIDKAVGRMIITSVEIQEILICQIRDVHRISAGLTAVSSIREQRVHDFTLQNIVR